MDYYVLVFIFKLVYYAVIFNNGVHCIANVLCSAWKIYRLFKSIHLFKL